MSPTKDRYNEMLQIQHGVRDTSNNKSNTDENKSGGIGQAFEKAEDIRGHIQIIIDNTKRANEILKNNVFKISKDLQDELDSLFRTSTTTAYKINNNLKEFESDLHKIKEVTSTEYRIKKVQYTTLKQEFQEALRASSSSLEYHRNKRKELLKKSIQTARGNVEESELEALLDENKLDIFTDNHLITTEEARQQLADLEERHKELLKIEKHLNEILDLFIRVATLVEEQQESINRVEYHAIAATDYIEQGAIDLSKSARSKKRYQKRKTYFILIGIIILLSIILLLVLFY